MLNSKTSERELACVVDNRATLMEEKSSKKVNNLFDFRTVLCNT